MYGPVRTVVWQGSAGDCRPYADLVGFPDKWPRSLMRFARQVVNDKGRYHAARLDWLVAWASAHLPVLSDRGVS